MAPRHLGHNWYSFEIDQEVTNWILSCLSEQIAFVQPYDNIHIKAKKTLAGQNIYKAVFSGKYNDHYNFPVCYLLDLNTGKFKGNNMHYCIDNNGTHYADVFPVYHDRFKFNKTSKYYSEGQTLWRFLSTLEVPDAVPTRKERRYIAKKVHSKRTNALPRSRVGYGGKKKKLIIPRDFALKPKT
jgi:hypothetical protein